MDSKTLAKQSRGRSVEEKAKVYNYRSDVIGKECVDRSRTKKPGDEQPYREPEYDNE